VPAVALLGWVAKATVTGSGTGCESVKVKTALVVPALPSRTTGSLIEIWRAVSSSVICANADVSPSDALMGALRVTRKNSLPFGRAVPTTGTVIVCVVVPAANVTVPVVAAKSPGDVAVLLLVVKVTDTGAAIGSESVRVKTAGVVPLWPSTTSMSPMKIWRRVSSSKIVAKAEGSARFALAGALRLTKKNSSPRAWPLPPPVR
jgi:hypothetical protein